MVTTSHLMRRNFCFCCLGIPAAALLGRSASATPSPDKIVSVIMADAAEATIHIHRLRGGVAVLEGSGGNVAVITGSEGKLLVDGGIAASRPQMATALETLGAAPIVQLINTHWHFDHTGGNAWLRGAGARILAQENTRKHMLTVQHVADWAYAFPIPLAQAVPDQVFDAEHTLRHAGLTLDLRHYGPAHTDSDISVRVRELDILHCGDTFWNGAYPMIDYSNGGTIDGMIRAAEANLARVGEHTIVIPGHGSPVSDRAGLQAFRDMLVSARGRVARAKQGGASLEAIIAGKPTAPWDARWGQFVISPELFTRLIYEGI